MTTYNMYKHLGFVNSQAIKDASGNASIVPGQVYRLYGFTAWGVPRPAVGDTVEYELQNSVIVFDVEAVENAGDPPDMFFVSAKAVERHRIERG